MAEVWVIMEEDGIFNVREAKIMSTQSIFVDIIVGDKSYTIPIFGLFFSKEKAEEVFSQLVSLESTKTIQ